MKPIIAIDGPAASGKGTLGRKIANIMEYAYLDTGALYRAVGLQVLINCGNPEDERAAHKAALDLQMKVKRAASPQEILSNPELRKDHVGQAASKVAAIQSVRDALLDLQRNFAKNPPHEYKGVILDGRDIGTVVCPDADVKLYITASTEVRAERRTKELQSDGQDVTYSAVLKDMEERDARDRQRSTAPMIKAEDAYELDTSDLNQAEVFEKALEIIRKNVPV